MAVVAACSGDFVFVVNELDNSVTACAYCTATGALRELAHQPAIPGGWLADRVAGTPRVSASAGIDCRWAQLIIAYYYGGQVVDR
jgi:6-phosphogluconolactonase (cycloisomerase 2 family)